MVSLPSFLTSIFDLLNNYIDKLFNYSQMVSTMAGYDFSKILFTFLMILLGILIFKWRIQGMGRLIAWVVIILGIIFALYSFKIIG